MKFGRKYDILYAELFGRTLYMNMLYLKYAVEVARVGSINKAAEELYVAQPNLSRAIKELEKELGIAIFERNSRGMTLTPEGATLIRNGKTILHRIDELEEMFRGNGMKKNVFSISVPRAEYISYAFANFSKYLGTDDICEIYYKETNAMRTINNVLHGDYRLGIIRYAEQYDKYFKDMLDRKNLMYEMVSEFYCAFLTGKDSPLASSNETSCADTEKYIEVSEADPYVPTLPPSEVRHEELPEEVKRRIFVFERASLYDVLAKNPDTFAWVSPVSEETLDRYGLVQKRCPYRGKIYKDVLIYSTDYHLTKLDKLFITELCDAKRKFL